MNKWHLLDANTLSFIAAFEQSPRTCVRSDLHLDQLDERLRDRNAWVEGAVSCLSCALAIREREKWPIIVSMEFFLKGALNAGTQVHGLARLAAELSHTPPALTLYRSGAEPWAVGTAFRNVEFEPLPAGLTGVRVLWQEWHDDEVGEFDRRLWLVPAPDS